MNPKERKYLKKIERIANPEGRFEFLRLDKNERLEPVSNRVLRGYKKALSTEIMSIYPELEETKKVVARYVNLPPKHVFLSHGSDAAIKQIFEVFAIEESNVVLLSPTYTMYHIYTTMAGVNPKWIKCNDQFVVDERELMESIDQNVSIVAIANPNSPTGSEFTVNFLFECLKKCQKLGIVLLIDEAYFPFSKTTMINYVDKEDNLVVTRTFSKAFALAGCRAGFMAVSSNLIKSIRKARPMYELSTLSALAIRVALQNLDEVDLYVKEVGEGKRYLIEESRKLGLIPYPTHANFINIQLPNKWSASKLEDFAKEKGILLKGKLGSGCFKNHIRVTLGPKKYMIKFVMMLKEFELHQTGSVEEQGG